MTYFIADHGIEREATPEEIAEIEARQAAAAAKQNDVIKGQMEDVVQRHLDATAQSLGFDNIYTACTYADEPSVPRFQQDGQRLRAWRSRVWDECYQLLEAVKAGAPIPTADQLIASLPTLQ